MADEPQVLTFDEFAKRYCERQKCTPDELRAKLQDQCERFDPDGWMLLECIVLDSSRCGEYTIYPYGPSNTYKEPIKGHISPRGLTSDISTVVAVLLNH